MKNIKLIIWDMDETFWQGTLSEEGAVIAEEHVDMIRQLTDRGIINSICSKNDFESVQKKLESVGVWNYFVFPKIEWSSKGPLVNQIIEQAQLRAPNVLFLDDNHLNLKEVETLNPGIHCREPEFVRQILSHNALKGKDDRDHTRLDQYKILEKKAVERLQCLDTTDFLRESKIQVSVIEKNLEIYFERIHELVQRTNQLNYTKRRDSAESLGSILDSNDYRCGVVNVQDRFGDYGIVGFFAISLAENRLVHFVLSCRVINLGVEHFLYNTLLNQPTVAVEGEVAINLDPDFTPDWINAASKNGGQKNKDRKQIDVLLKGGCDLEQMAHYFLYNGLNVETEFNYPTNQDVPVHREHSTSLFQHIDLSREQKKKHDRGVPIYRRTVF